MMASKKVSKATGSSNDANEADVFMAALDHPLKAEIEAIRALIRGADKRIQESVKWNAPSFYIEEHFATLNLRPVDAIQVILHTGAKAKSNSKVMNINDPTSLLKWVAKDRCVLTFSSVKDIRSKKAAFVSILKQWIEQL